VVDVFDKGKGIERPSKKQRFSFNLGGGSTGTALRSRQRSRIVTGENPPKGGGWEKSPNSVADNGGMGRLEKGD